MALEKFKFDVAIIGGGAIGLALAKFESESGKSVVVLERENSLGSITTSRNSEVVHAGIYYATGSLKHQLCISGRKLLYEYLKDKNIPYKKCGKIIFCNSSSDHINLEKIQRRASDNGLTLEYCTLKQLAPYEGLCNISRGLWSSETGIFDSHTFVQSLGEDVLSNDGLICVNTSVVNVNIVTDQTELQCITGSEEFIVEAGQVYNAGGLDALNIAKKTSLDGYSNFENYYVKGHYYSSRRKINLTSLLYPMPTALGLGVHLTFDMAGQIRFGPDTLPLGTTYNYKNEVSDQIFFEKVADNFPGISFEDLHPAYTGIRPKLKRNGKVVQDFIVEKVPTHNMVNLLGIESPGLTASLAIAKHAIEVMRGE